MKRPPPRKQRRPLIKHQSVVKTWKVLSLTGAKVKNVAIWAVVFICLLIVVQYLSLDYSADITVVKKDIENKKEKTYALSVNQRGSKILGVSNAHAPANHKANLGISIDGSITLDYSRNFISLWGVHVDIGLGVLQKNTYYGRHYSPRIVFSLSF